MSARSVATGTPAPEPTSGVLELTLRQVERDPSVLAAVDSRRRLTYGELRARAAGLAQELWTAGVEPGDRVGVALDASVHVPVALLGTLLAGAAYVPLDPALPDERLAYVLSDSGARALVAERDADTGGLPLLRVEDVREASAFVARPATLDALAYVVYTSGTSGWSKGVAVSHASLAAVVRGCAELLELDERPRVLQHTSLGFDPATLEVFLALASGGTLVHAPRETVLAPGGLEALIGEHAVEVWVGTPTLLGLVDPRRAPTLTRLLVGGEVLPPRIAQRWGPDRRCFNVYGPTEGTVLTTAQRCDGVERSSPPLGRPLPGRIAAVVDDALRPLPAGEVGEICLGGLALADGYWERSELTAQQFTTLAEGPPGRFYRTGDLGQMGRDGTLHFVGRRDRQVKVRGHRIELEEIERALLELPGVVEAAVTVSESSGGTRLVAHIGGAERLADDHLRAQLERRLPSSMIPHAFVAAAALPRTLNGKVATSELAPAEPNGADRPDGSADELERVLLRIFRTVLGREDVTIEDDFFLVGGDSLDVVNILTDALDHGIEIAPQDFYEQRSVAGLAAAARGTIVEAE
jgi:amino acid adenylation domain-containing protein